MSEKIDSIQAKVLIDSTQAINALGKLQMEAKDLKQEIKGMTEGSKAFINANSKLDAVNADIAKLRTEMGLTGMTMRQLRSYSKELEIQLNNTAIRGTAEYTKLRTELQRVNKAIEQQRAEVKGSEGVWAKLRKEVGTFGMMAAGYLGFEAITGKIGSIIQNNAKLSDSLADIRKTTDLSASSIKQLDTILRGMDTRTPIDKLRQLAAEAGKLGKNSVKDVAAFVEQADKITVALGEDLGEDAIIQLGKLSNIFGNEMINIASAINEVGAASEASEGYQVDFLNRMSGVGPTAKIAADELLGYGATLESLGQSQEVAATALNTTLLDFVANTEKFGQAAGMARGELSAMVKEDGTNQAFLAFLDNIKKSSGSTEEFINKLKDLGINGARESNVLLTLANNTDNVREQQILANAAIQNGSSVIDEFNIRNENLAAKLEKLQKWIGGIFTNSAITKGLEFFIGGLADLVDNSEKLSLTMEKERVSVNALVMEMTNANTSAQRRKDIYDELNKIAPTVLDGITKESISYVKLRENLEKYNKEQINRIVIQKAQEKIDEQRDITAKELEKNLESQKELQKILAELATKNLVNQKQINKISQDENLTLEEKAKKILDLMGGIKAYDDAVIRANGSKNEFARGNTDLIKLGDAYTDLRSSVERVNKELDITNLLSKDLEETQKILGIAETTPPPTVTPDDNGDNNEDKKGGGTPTAGGGTVNDGSDDLQKEAEENHKMYLKMLENLKTYQTEVAKLEASQNERKAEGLQLEYQLIDEKYAVQLEKLITGQKSLDDMKFLIEDEYNIRKAEYDLEIQKITDLKEQEKAQKMRDAEFLFAQEKEAFLDSLYQTTFTAHELELIETDKYYAELVAKAEKYGIDTRKLRQQQVDTLDAIDTKYYRQNVQKSAENFQTLMGGFTDFTGGYLALLDSSTSEAEKKNDDYIRKVRQIKLLEIAANSASAIASVVAYAASSSPDPITLAARIAAGTGIVLTNIAKAKSLMGEGNNGGSTARTDDNEQSANGASFGGGQGDPRVQKRAKGGNTGIGGENGSIYFKPTPTAELSWINEEGPEWIAPNWMVQNPKYQPVIQYLESERLRGFADGGMTGAADIANAGMTEEKAKSRFDFQILVDELILMKNVNRMLVNTLSKPIEAQAIIGDNEIDEIKKKIDLIEDIEILASSPEKPIGFLPQWSKKKKKLKDIFKKSEYSLVMIPIYKYGEKGKLLNKKLEDRNLDVYPSIFA